MNTNEKLTGGRKPFIIDSTDGAVVTKKFYCLVVLENATFTALESGVGTTLVNEKIAININAKIIPAGTVINADGEAFFNKVHLATGMVAGYIPFV